MDGVVNSSPVVKSQWNSGLVSNSRQSEKRICQENYSQHVGLNPLKPEYNMHILVDSKFTVVRAQQNPGLVNNSCQSDKEISKQEKLLNKRTTGKHSCKRVE